MVGAEMAERKGGKVGLVRWAFFRVVLGKFCLY